MLDSGTYTLDALCGTTRVAIKRLGLASRSGSSDGRCERLIGASACRMTIAAGRLNCLRGEGESGVLACAQRDAGGRRDRSSPTRTAAQTGPDPGHPGSEESMPYRRPATHPQLPALSVALAALTRGRPSGPSDSGLTRRSSMIVGRRGLPLGGHRRVLKSPVLIPGPRLHAAKCLVWATHGRETALMPRGALTIQRWGCRSERRDADCVRLRRGELAVDRARVRLRGPVSGRAAPKEQRWRLCLTAAARRRSAPNRKHIFAAPPAVNERAVADR